MLICFNASFTEIFDNDHLNYRIFLSYLLDKEHCVYISIEKLVRYLVLNGFERFAVYFSAEVEIKFLIPCICA